MNVDQAVSHMEEMIRTSVAGLDPKPRLERDEGAVDYSLCVDPTDGGSEERVMVGRRYYLRDVPASSYDSLARQVLQNFKSLGYSLDGEPQLDGSQPAVYALDTKNSFVISLITGGDGLYIGTGSPCLWPDGIPGHTYVDASGIEVPPGTQGAKLVVVPTD